MFRAVILTFALGLSPAIAEDAAPILDGLPICDGACPETTVTAMSSDLNGDGEAEYFEIFDAEPEITLADADCSAGGVIVPAATCAAETDAL